LRVAARSKANPPPPISSTTLFVPNLKNGTTEEEFVAFVRCACSATARALWRFAAALPTFNPLVQNQHCCMLQCYKVSQEAFLCFPAKQS
jgi:hypothetical protein